jgi:casein kinase II subunit beta
MSSSKAWLTQFLDDPRCRLLLRVDDEFLHNSFNITGAKHGLPHFTFAYELLRRGMISPAMEADREVIEKEAEILYCVLHHRFLLTRAGMHLLHEKFQLNQFQQCPRVHCKGAQCLPYGISEEFGRYSVKWYCTGCSDVYNAGDPELEKLDGSAFGPSWIHMFLQKFPEVIPPGPVRVYVPKIFGFRIAQPGIADQESDEPSDEQE